MRLLAPSLLLALGLFACTPAAAPIDIGGLPPCETLQMEDLTGQECRIEASGETLHVTFAPLAEGADAGMVEVDVLRSDGTVLQTLNEGGVSEYLMPNVEDVDGDGHADLLIRRESGNANSAMGVWIFSRARSRYERAGEVSGVEIKRTADGYIAVPARSGAGAWNVAFFRLDQDGLRGIVTVSVEAREVTADGQVTEVACAVSDAPGIAALGLSFDEAEQKFCAEPAAQVFGQ